MCYAQFVALEQAIGTRRFRMMELQTYIPFVSTRFVCYLLRCPITQCTDSLASFAAYQAWCPFFPNPWRCLVHERVLHCNHFLLQELQYMTFCADIVGFCDRAGIGTLSNVCELLSFFFLASLGRERRHL